MPWEERIYILQISIFPENFFHPGNRSTLSRESWELHLFSRYNFSYSQNALIIVHASARGRNKHEAMGSQPDHFSVLFGGINKINRNVAPIVLSLCSM